MNLWWWMHEISTIPSIEPFSEVETDGVQTISEQSSMAKHVRSTIGLKRQSNDRDPRLISFICSLTSLTVESEFVLIRMLIWHGKSSRVWDVFYFCSNLGRRIRYNDNAFHGGYCMYF